MTRTSTARRRHSWRERAVVLGGFAVAAIYTAIAAILGTGMEAACPLWLAAVLWTVPSSLVLALRSGIREGGWSAFRDYELPEDTDTLDWSTKSGAWYDLALAEENERQLLGN